jgi:pimeloyl-ACP methyl ester carboxylesterase
MQKGFTNDFSGPMPPWPDLAKYARQVTLSKAGLTIFLYDTRDSELPSALLLHGLGDEADTWRYIIEPLSAFYRVLAPDLPGFGRSEGPDKGYTLPFFCQALLELLQVLDISHTTLIGHSLGGVISHTITLENPQVVERLVLVSGSLVSRSQKLNLQSMLFMIPGLGEWMYNHLRKDPQAAYASLEPYYHDLAGLPPKDRDFLYKRVNQRVWSDGQRRAYFSTLRNLVPYVLNQQRGLEARLAKLGTPTLVIWGQDDQVMPAENGLALAELQPSARLVLLPDTGHNVQQDSPQALLDAVLGDERFNPHIHKS